MENQKKIEESQVERDAEGVPSAWRLFAVGDNRVTSSTEDGMLKLTSDDVNTIVKRYEQKGLSIPIDGEHYIEHLAKAMNLDGDELAKAAPYKDGEGTLGFGRLENRDDGLWITVEKWNDAAKALIKGGQFRYFSPWIKGLDGESPLRVTSVALTNTPKLDGISEIGCSDFSFSPTSKTHQQPKEATMEPGKDPAKKEAGCADGDPAALTPEEIKALQDEVTALKAKIAEIEKKDEEDAAELGLSETDPAKRRTAVKSFLAKSKDNEKRIAELELSERERKLDAVVARGVAEGKLTVAEIPHLRKLGEIGLADYLKTAVGKVPLDRLGKVAPVKVAELSLSDDERIMAQRMGITQEQMLAAKKQQNEQGE